MELSWRGHWIATAAFAVVWPCLVALGFWQLHRAEAKTALMRQFALQAHLPPASVVDLCLLDAENRYRPVTARGHYDPRQVFLDNQIHDKTVGYHVYTPLILAEAPVVVMVNRGWLPADPARQVLPWLAAPKGEITVQGRLALPANPAIKLGQMQPDHWPQVVQHLDFSQLSDALGASVAPAVVLLDADQPDGATRAWTPTFGGFGPERHRGYAVQWFALAAALLALFLIYSLRLPSALPPDASGDASS